MAFAVRSAVRAGRSLVRPLPVVAVQPRRTLAGEAKRELRIQYTKIRDSYQFRTALPDDYTPRKVTVVGAAGGIGQPLSMLLKTDPNVTELALFDVATSVVGVAADLSHCNTGAVVKGYAGESAMATALEGADVVVIPAGVPRKPGMSRDDLFNTNATIVANIAKAAAKACPNACFLIISNPVNSTVPIFAEVLKKAGVYNANKVFGVTLLDIARANTFVSENQGLDVFKTNVPVIGGHAGITILPLLSQVEGANFSATDKEQLTKRIMFGGDEVVQAKAGAGSATLSMAYAGSVFSNLVLRALNGENNLVACAYVQSEVEKNNGLEWFASPIELGREGIARIRGYGKIDAFEQAKLNEAIPQLKTEQAKGVAFGKSFPL